mmetsp:Transcript_12197/g.23434  ORF Transcript_12197/g.23434 Transcript_12197/m.23434 type:complete len:195 (-) Transcript_12197:73-657(-)
MAEGASGQVVLQNVASHCNAFEQRFFTTHCEKFTELTSGRVEDGEQKVEWHGVYKEYLEQAELTLQSAALLWGASSTKQFEQDFLEAAEESHALDGFLALADYPAFIARMFEYVQGQHEHEAKLAEDWLATGGSGKSKQSRLAEIGRRLADLEFERVALLAERRRLTGATGSSTANALKFEIEKQRWRSDVGND